MASYLLVQISDVHLSSNGTIPPGVRPRDNLVAAVKLLADAHIRPDVLVLTGDLADAGDPICYEDLSALMTVTAGEIGATVVYLPGNHDDRGAFRRNLLHEGDDTSPINQVTWHKGLRIVALDSTVPGIAWGMLGDETLTFLEEALKTPAPDGTVLALHHPPISSPIEEMARLALRGPGRLGKAIAGTDVRIVLCGHYHHGAMGTLGTIPVWVSPAVAYLADVTSRSEFRGVPGSAMSRVDIDSMGTRTSVIPVASR